MGGRLMSEWHVRDDALRMYRETDLTPDQIAEHLGIDPATVLEWIQKNGRLRQIHMPQNRMKLRARRMEILRLSALNYDDDYIRKVMGLSPRTNLRRTRIKALSELAEELRDQGAWEKERAKHVARLEALLSDWIPKAIGNAAEPKFGDLALKALGQIAQVSGFNTINIHASSDEPAPAEPDADVKAVLASLSVLASRIPQPGAVIDGELASPDAEPVSELPSQNGLTTQHE